MSFIFGVASAFLFMPDHFSSTQAASDRNSSTIRYDALRAVEVGNYDLPVLGHLSRG